MKILILGTPLTFVCVPRIYPIVGDDLKLYLRDELKSKVIEPVITFTIAEKLSIHLTTQPSEFAAQNKYEIELKNGDVTIYKGKLIVLEEGTDTQNYENGSQSTSRFKYND